MDENELIHSIRKNETEREKAIRWLYSDKELRNGVSKVIHSKDEHTVNDIFNLSIVQLMKTILKNPSFQFKSSYKSYIYGIARNVYYQQLKSERKSLRNDIENYTDLLTDMRQEPIDLLIINNEKKHVLEQILNQLEHSCKEILNLWAQGVKMKNIAEDMNYASSGYARKKKHLCLKKLLKIIEDNPNFKNELLD